MSIAKPDGQPITNKINVVSGVSFETLKPFVTLEWGDMKGQVTVEEARQHALDVLAVAEAAEQDAFIVWFMREKVKAPLESVATLLAEFRSKRGEFEKGKK